jgi:chemotaxis protein CheC
MEYELNDMQISALKEATNIGAGHAAIALSQMLSKKIMIAVASADIVPSDVFLHKMVGDNKLPLNGVYLKTFGDAQGAIVFMFKDESALKLCDLLLFRESGYTKSVDEQGQAVLMELGSILTGSFFSVLADMLRLKVFNKAPAYVYDSADVLMHGIFKDVFGDIEQRLCFATEFIESNQQISGVFAFIPAQDAMVKILETLNAN